jgi:hypothetical protein
VDALASAAFAKNPRPCEILTAVVAETKDPYPVCHIANPDNPAVVRVMADATHTLKILALAEYAEAGGCALAPNTRSDNAAFAVVARSEDPDPVLLIADAHNSAIVCVVADATHALGELAFAGDTIPSLARAGHTIAANTGSTDSLAAPGVLTKNAATSCIPRLAVHTVLAQAQHTIRWRRSARTAQTLP